MWIMVENNTHPAFYPDLAGNAVRIYAQGYSIWSIVDVGPSAQSDPKLCCYMIAQRVTASIVKTMRHVCSVILLQTKSSLWVIWPCVVQLDG